MLKLTVAIPVFNQLEETKGQWGCHLENIIDKASTEILVINNGSTDGTRDFINDNIFIHFADHRMIDHQENIGVLASMNEAWREARGDIVAIFHNDLYIYEYGYDKRIISEFEKDEKLGLAGFLGSRGIANNGGRINVISNMLEAELHGLRKSGVENVAVFDGLALIGRKAMFEKVGGFDQGFTYHHFYDKSISIESLKAGYVNKMIGVYCHHRGGITANRPDYGKWIANKMGVVEGLGDLESYKKSEAYFLNKYRTDLPIVVQSI
jgi:glycosyltransferase involved in cell wall biosynthesis